MKMKQRGPSAFTVLAVDVPKGRDVECGHFDTFEAAQARVKSDEDGVIEYYEIWQGDRIVDRRYPAGW